MAAQALDTDGMPSLTVHLGIGAPRCRPFRDREAIRPLAAADGRHHGPS